MLTYIYLLTVCDDDLSNYRTTGRRLLLYGILHDMFAVVAIRKVNSVDTRRHVSR